MLPLAWRRRELAGRAAIVCSVIAAAATVVILLAFALDAYASPGTWIEAIDAIVFLAVGVWVLRHRPQDWRVGAAIGIGLVALAVGLLEGAIYLHPIVLAVLPGTACRVVDVVAMGTGLAAVTLGCLFYLETARQAPRADPYPRFPAASAQSPWFSE